MSGVDLCFLDEAVMMKIKNKFAEVFLITNFKMQVAYKNVQFWNLYITMVRFNQRIASSQFALVLMKLKKGALERDSFLSLFLLFYQFLHQCHCW